MDTTKILTREEVAKEHTWATEDLYTSDQAFLADFDLMKEKIAEISNFRDTVFTSAKGLLAFFQFQEELAILADKVMHYSMLKSDEDTGNSTYQDYKTRCTTLAVELDSAFSFFKPQLMTVSSETLASYYLEEPALAFYEKAIEDTRRFAPHTLDEKGELLLAMAGEIADSPHNIYNLLSNADLNFAPVTVKGQEYEITQGSFVPHLQNPDQEVRKEVFTSYYKSYDQFKNTFAATLSGQIKQLAFYSTTQNYPSALEASLFKTQVSPSVYHNLIKTVHDNIHYMHDYVSLRKKLLGLEELHMYDVYAPLVPDSTEKISFEEAREHVLKSTEVFGAEYNDILKSGFNNRWIDIYENKGKRSGAYSAGSRVHPFVLLNHHDNLDSEFTLAHEMGHALHSYFSNLTQSPVYSDYEIFVAEVASTCNESLLMQHLLKQTTDKKERAALINYFLEQFKGTLYRQTMFAEFELKINEMVAAGESLTADVLSKEYKALNEFYFGPDMVIDEEVALEWARIPHFYYNFYVFQYATGFSAAIALSKKILEEGAPAIERYLNFLKSGCTKDPVSLLRDAGVDMASPEPVALALELFGELIKEMDELTRE